MHECPLPWAIVMQIYRNVLRPALFTLTPDQSHSVSHALLRWALPWRALSGALDLRVSDDRLKTTFAGVELPNPVGLAAGFDKDAELLGSLSYFGFGFICVGSIMPEPRFGNPFPRLVRYIERESVADSMGVPSRGRARALAHLRRHRSPMPPIFANVGGFSSQAIAEGVVEILPHVDAVEISLMCPNVLKKNERFDELGMLRGVLDRIGDRAPSLIVRVPNDTAAADDRLAELVETCAAANIGGLKIGGGRPVNETGLGTGRGTLHGRAVFEAALANVERGARFARGRVPIKGNGGISTADDVLAMRRAGAVCVDIYSAFIFQGWTVARDINRDLLKLMDSGQSAQRRPA
ncbi:dihydroorotate dehydrogenase [Nitrobacteraceae bacterium AZCC 2146]